MQYGLSVGSGILLYFDWTGSLTKIEDIFFSIELSDGLNFGVCFFLIWRPIHLLIRYHLALLTKMLKEEVVTTGIPLQVIKYPNFNWTLIVVKIVLTLASSFFDSMIFRKFLKICCWKFPETEFIEFEVSKMDGERIWSKNFFIRWSPSFSLATYIIPSDTQNWLKW